MVAQLAGAEGACLELGARRLSWGLDDPGFSAGPCVELLWLDDATNEPRFTGRTPAPASVLGVPVRVDARAPVQGALWLFHSRAQAFAPELQQTVEGAAGLIAAVAPHDEGETLRTIAARLPVAAVAVRGERLELNAAATALIGAGPGDVQTLDGWFERLFLEEAAQARALYEADRATGFLDSRTLPLTRADGSQRLVEFVAGTSAGSELWLLYDVTERFASQERFRALFEQSSTAHLLIDELSTIDCNPAAVALLGYRSRSDLCRHPVSELSPEVQPDGTRSAIEAAVMRRIASTEGHHRFDWVHRRADGTPVEVEASLTPLRLGAREVLLMELHDITERVAYEKGLKQARDEALSFARAKSDFLATMSHEIRTPMNGVIGMTRLLLDTPLGEQQREYVETVRACGEGLLALINDILDFSRLEAGKVQLEAIPFSLRDVVDDALSVVAPAAEDKGLELVAFVAPQLPEALVGDPTRLRQVLLNLLSNAVKFTTRGSVQLRLQAAAPDETGRCVLTVSVADTGIGIAPEALPRLFNAFSQEDTSTTRRFGGSGLGLAICKRLVALAGGIIDVVTSPSGSTFSLSLSLGLAAPGAPGPAVAGVEAVVLSPRPLTGQAMTERLSGLGLRARHLPTLQALVESGRRPRLVLLDAVAQEPVGEVIEALHALGAQVGVAIGLRRPSVGLGAADFVVTRPLRRRPLAEQLKRVLGGGGPSLSAPAPVVPLELRCRVLVAEDNSVNQRVIQGLLGRLRAEVTLVPDGKAALAAMAAQPFDLVLMDCQMPELDGLEATRRQRAAEAERGGHLPIVALTAGVMDDDRERCLQAGMDDFLAKPVRLEDLERTLRTWSRRNAQPVAA
jgi:PAS domain S-box-containing protein